MSKFLELLPGIALAFAAVLVAKEVTLMPFPPFTLASGIHPISSVLIVLVLGMALGNLARIPKCSKGVNYTSDNLLQSAIILLGAKLNFHYVFALSFAHIFIIIASVIFAYLFTVFLASKFKRIDKEAGALLAFGTAICGSAAIAALGGIAKAKRNNVTIAVAVVALCGTIAMFLYPYLGEILGMTSKEFGLLAGSTVQSVPQTIGTGMIFSEEAGDKATITKLVRILMLCPMIVIYLVYSKKVDLGNAHFSQDFTKYVPPFIIGFIAMSAASTGGVFPHHIINLFSWAASFLILMAMFGIGYNTNIREMMKTCREAIIVGIISSLALFAFTYLLIITI